MGLKTGAFRINRNSGHFQGGFSVVVFVAAEPGMGAVTAMAQICGHWHSEEQSMGV